MTISSPRYPFNQATLNGVPDRAGVYALYDGTTVIYYGCAQGGIVTIRSRLQRHFRGDEGACTKSATHFTAEPCTNPVTREEELLNEFKNLNNRLPRCNTRVGLAPSGLASQPWGPHWNSAA